MKYIPVMTASSKKKKRKKITDKNSAFTRGQMKKYAEHFTCCSLVRNCKWLAEAFEAPFYAVQYGIAKPSDIVKNFRCFIMKYLKNVT